MTRTVLGLGDSISYGMGDVGENWIGPSWVGRLAHVIDAHRVVNLATPGQRAVDLGRVQLTGALQVGADVALLSIGGNDLLRTSFSPASVHSAVSGATQSLTAQGTRVVVLGLPDPPTHARMPRWLRRAITERAQWTNHALGTALNGATDSGMALFIDIAADPASRDRSYWHIDCMHPSPSGHEYLADQVRAWLGMGRVKESLPVTGKSTPSDGIDPRTWLIQEGLPWVARRSVDVIPQMAVTLAAHPLTRRRHLRHEAKPLPSATSQHPRPRPHSLERRTTSSHVHVT